MFLNDEKYEDDNGRFIDRSEIDTIGTYEFGGDGFFKWACGNCSEIKQSRGFKIGGTVWKCSSCGKKNLLARTDIKFITQITRTAERRDSELEGAVRNALRHLGQAVSALGK